MHERFDDAAKAACWIGLGLSNDFPSKNVEITYRSAGFVRQQVCSTGTAERVVGQMVRRFHQSDVVYQPESTDGVVVRVECHCLPGYKGNCCSRGEDRPNVTIRVVHVNAADVEPQPSIT